MGNEATQTEHVPVQMRVPFSASSVPVVRGRLMQWMANAGSSQDCVEDARVILSELVANAIRHAQPLADGTIEVSWRADGDELEIAVSDGGGPTHPHTIVSASCALAGRGMSIIDTLASSWWAERTRSTSTVHARLARM